MAKKKLSIKEYVAIVILSVAVAGGIAYLFYHSMWGMCCLPVVGVIVAKRWVHMREVRAQSQLQEAFIHGLQILSGSLQSGLSLENAWKEVEKETLLLHQEQSRFYQEIRQMNRSVTYNVPVETLFLEVAHRLENEEMIRFAQIMEFGKHNGGNWKRIIEESVLRMLERHETQKEIEVMLAAKRMEQKVMNVVPLGMLLFLKVSSWEYVSVLYETMLGRIVMTICLMLYGAAWMLSERIMDIQV